MATNHELVPQGSDDEDRLARVQTKRRLPSLRGLLTHFEQGVGKDGNVYTAGIGPDGIGAVVARDPADGNLEWGLVIAPDPETGKKSMFEWSSK